MVKKKVDSRIQGLIENGVRKNHRSFFVMVGDYGKNQVENLHRILSKVRVKARPSVLWCYKKELGFSTHRKKRMNEIKRDKQRGLHDPDVDDPFDIFISTTDIRWSYYKDTEKVLGQTFGVCVLQDFEALTPNLLARTIETVEGGGMVILLLKTVRSLKQLYTMTMDVHTRFRTEAYHEVVPRFNERFILSLGDCSSCLVVDDELNILPISNATLKDLPLASTEYGGGGEYGTRDRDLSGFVEDPQLTELKASVLDTPNAGVLVALCRTLDQAKAVLSFLDAITERTLRSTVTLTAARGRGKSAAIGLCLAASIAYGYSNVFVTAPSPDNLRTVFEFVVKGLIALKYKEHSDFDLKYDNSSENGRLVVCVNVFRSNRQTIQYVEPNNTDLMGHAELVAIDEAAAIPLPVVKRLMGNYLVFMSSTVNGYEGTGRALSLKLINQLRQQQGASMAASAAGEGNAVAGPRKMKGKHKVHEERWRVAAESAKGGGGNFGARTLTELTLETPIRYGRGCPVEIWLNKLLCLDSAQHLNRIVTNTPPPSSCELYLVDRDALFSRHALSEALLQRIWSLYTSAHYKNTPNDLQMLSDAPGHRLFILLGPNAMAAASASSSGLPDVLCVVQVAFEGEISQKSVQAELAKGNQASGDMIPWVMSQQYNDYDFAGLSGARIVRIATHPDVQKLGYGGRAVELLAEYFRGELTPPGAEPRKEGTLDAEDAAAAMKEGRADAAELQEERVAARKRLPPLLTHISEWPTIPLDWVGVSFGLTPQLLKFWGRHAFRTCYIRQTRNELTGEHSTVVLRELVRGGEGGGNGVAHEGPNRGWLKGYVEDYRKRLGALFGFNLRTVDAQLALSLMDPDRSLTMGSDGAESSSSQPVVAPLSASELTTAHLSQYDLQRLEMYARNMADHHMILDVVPTVARLVCHGRINSVRLGAIQLSILIAIGLQHKSVDVVCSELDLPANQVLAFFNKAMRKISTKLREVLESAAENEMGTSMSRVVAREREVKAMSGLGRSLADDQDQDERVFHREEKQQRSSLLSPGSDKGSSKALKKHAIGDDVADAALDAAFKRAAKTKGGLAPTSISVAVNGSGTTGAAGGSEEKSAQNRDKGTKRKGRDDEHGHKKKSKKEKREKERR